MIILNPNIVSKISENFKVNSIYGRWITIDSLENKIFEKLHNSKNISINKIGYSEEKRNIYDVTIGKGPKKYLFGLKCMETKVLEPKL